MADERPKMSDAEVLAAITGLPTLRIALNDPSLGVPPSPPGAPVRYEGRINGIDERVLALAAGLDAADPELGWDRIASILERLGLGTYKADDLVRAVDVWLMQNGTQRAAVSAAVRNVKRKE